MFFIFFYLHVLRRVMSYSYLYFTFLFLTIVFILTLQYLLLLLEGFHETSFDLLTVVKYGFQAMRKLKIGVHNLREDLQSLFLRWCFLAVLAQFGAHLVHKLFDLHYYVVACFPLTSG